MASRYQSKVGSMAIDPYLDISQNYPWLKDVLPASDVERGYSLSATDWDSAVRYLSFTYDPNSPMVREYPDLRKRKEAAQDETGCSQVPLPLILLFLQKVVRSRLWTLICSLEATYDEYTDHVHNPITLGAQDDILKAVLLKDKLLTHMDKIRTRIDELKEQMFEGDKDAEDEAAVIKGYRPEDMAKRERLIKQERSPQRGKRISVGEDSLD